MTLPVPAWRAACAGWYLAAVQRARRTNTYACTMIVTTSAAAEPAAEPAAGTTTPSAACGSGSCSGMLASCTAAFAAIEAPMASALGISRAYPSAARLNQYLDGALKRQALRFPPRCTGIADLSSYATCAVGTQGTGECSCKSRERWCVCEQACGSARAFCMDTARSARQVLISIEKKMRVFGQSTLTPLTPL